MATTWRRRLRSSLWDWAQMLRYSWHAGRLATVAVTVLSLAIAALPVLQLVLQGRLIASVPAAIGSGADSRATDRTITLLIATAVAMAGGRTANSVRAYVLGWLGPRYALEARRDLTLALHRPVGIANLEQAGVADELEVVLSAESTDVWEQAPTFATSLITRWAAGLGSVGILAAFEWWFPLLAVPGWVVDWRHGARYATGTLGGASSGAAQMRRARYFRELATGPPAAKELRAFGLVEWMLGQFSDAWRAAMEPVWKANRRGTPLLVAAAATKVITGAVMLLLVADAALRGDADLATVAIVAPAALSALQLGYLGSTSASLTQAVALAGRARRLELEMSESPPVPTGEGDGEPASGLPRRAIGFESVSFRYPGTDTLVLEELDVQIAAGSITALVGDNGAGKTTLVKLLARLYEPTGGRITVDGVPLTAIDVAAWRGRLAVIFQDFIRWELSLRENVGYGAVGHLADAALLERSLRDAGGGDLPATLSKGWDTVLSRAHDDGTDLSGGQWQKVALARALAAVHAGAGVLVLDEPTASLDVRAEAEVFGRLIELARGVTTLLVSHRLSSVRRADRILVLEGGRIIEDGSHEELLAADGRYARMFRLQADRFADERAQHAQVAVAGNE